MKKLLLSSLLLTQSLFCSEEKPQYRFSGKEALEHLTQTGECHHCNFYMKNLDEALAQSRKNNFGKKINLSHSYLYYATITTEDKKNDLDLTGANTARMETYRYSGEQAIKHLEQTGECHDCSFFAKSLIETLATVRENHPGKKINLRNANLQYASITTEDRDDLFLTGAITDKMSSYRWDGKKAIKHLTETGECNDCFLVGENLTHAIAAFKESNPKARIDLQRTTLYEAYLKEADLTDVDLTDAKNLKHAHIDNAYTWNTTIDRKDHYLLTWYQWLLLAPSKK
jgi:uncharacterized protein YjbI with pentapeptide repeats